MAGENVTKTAVSVSEMAKMVGLSRARFYQLVKAGTFPGPDKEPTTGRPFYPEEKQRACLEVRRRNCGINSQPILFYARRKDLGNEKGKPPKPKLSPKNKEVMALVDGLNSLGLTTTTERVEKVVKDLFPQGVNGQDQGEILRAVFLEIRRRNSGGSESGQ